MALMAAKVDGDFALRTLAQQTGTRLRSASREPARLPADRLLRTGEPGIDWLFPREPG